MKVKRLKRSRKAARFYINSFGFREPFRVIVDGTFCQAALTTKIHLQEQVPAYLGVKAQLVTTMCCVDEIDALGEPFRGAKLVAKRFEQRKCRCRGGVGGAEACVLALIGDDNPSHYCVATQDPALKQKLSAVPGVPVLSIIFGQLVLGKPSEASRATASNSKRALVGIAPAPSKAEVAAAAAAAAAAPKKKKKRKGKGGPNPLSVKKGKKGGAGKAAPASSSSVADGKAAKSAKKSASA